MVARLVGLAERARGSTGLGMVSIILLVLVVLGGVFAAYILLHYVLFLLASHPKDAAKIGHELNQFERRQLVEWAAEAGRFPQAR